MKYGLLYEKNTRNIGDDIQTYAAMQFLPQIDYLIDREKLDGIYGDEKEPIAVIMNAWFLNNKLNWPPANNIYPCCVSMHFAELDPRECEIGFKFLNGIGGDYLKYYGPVGCRDKGTEHVLHDKGIDAFFSGCLTLTLPKQQVCEHKRPYICLVDIEDSVCEIISKRLADKEMDVIRISHLTDLESNFEKRVENVKQLLTQYQNAHCVVTSRLHCALPWLAMEVPVLYVENRQEYRTKEFVQLLHHTNISEIEDFLNIYSLVNPWENKLDYLTIRENLMLYVTEFINKCERGQIKGRLYEATMEERESWKYNLIKEIIDQKNSIIDRYCADRMSGEVDYKKAIKAIVKKACRYNSSRVSK